MAYAPISLLIPQFQNPTDNTPYSGAVLKAYIAGTTTNLAMATDATGATTFTSIELNGAGYPQHLGAQVIPHINAAYKIALFATQAAADANTPAIWSIDNLTPITITGAFTLDDAVSTGVSNVVSITHTTTGTPVAGIGTAIEFVTETANSNNEIGMILGTRSTDVTATSEDFSFFVKLMAAGAAATDVLEITSLKAMNLLGAINTLRVTVASHATTSAIWAAVGNEIDLTGAETITNFPAAPQIGASRILYPASGIVLTHAGNITVQGNATRTAAAGEKWTVHAVTTTTFKVFLEKQDGTAVVGYTTEEAQDAVGAMVGVSLIYVDGTPLLARASLTGHVTSAQDSNALVLGSFTKAQLDTAVSDADLAILGANTFTGRQNFAAGADIASVAGTVDLTAATGNTVVITGTLATTAFTMTDGQQMILLPSGAWPLTYHATTMNINGGVSYTCAAGDRLYVVRDLADVIRVNVIKQDGKAVVVAAGANGLVWLSTVTASDSATVDIENTFNSTYDAYLLVVSGLVGDSAGADINLRLKIAGAYAVADYMYHVSVLSSGASTYNGENSASAASIVLSSLAAGSGTNANFTIRIYNPASTSLLKQIDFTGSRRTSTTVGITSFGFATHTGIGALTGLRFYMGANNILSGTFRLYGIANS